ncbi:MAG: class I SAM-dependent methyltransferase [Ignavibacteria bacterium]
MQQSKKVIDCYDKTAEEYAKIFFDELSEKPFDRMILKSFAEENSNKGMIADLGCGPGQTTRFLKECGVKRITGIDISPAMVARATVLNKGIRFETGDMIRLKYKDGHFGSAVAFYSIVHFTYPQVRKAFKEIHRVLRTSGQFLFSFHIGNEKIHRDNFLDHDVDIDFYFFETEKIMTLLKKTGFRIISAIERYPYVNAEHPSKRAYILAEKPV